MSNKLLICIILFKFVSGCNSQTNKNVFGQSFLKHISSNIDISKCIKYVGEDWLKYSTRQKTIIVRIQKELESNGIKLYNPIEIMAYNGHSKELQYNLRDIELFSKIFNKYFNDALIEANNFIRKDKSFKISSQEMYENGKIKSINKSGPVEDNYSIKYDFLGKETSFYFKVDNLFELQFEKDEKGVYISKQLSFLDRHNIFCNFSESTSGDDSFYFFSPGSDGGHIRANVRNNQIMDLSIDVTCGCPFGQKPDHGITKTLGTSLIEYSINNEGIIIYNKWWDNSKYHEANQVYDIKSNIFNIYEINDETKDTSTIIEGKLSLENRNGQINLYGENPFLDGQIPIKTRHWTREWFDDKELNYLDYIILFDKNGNEKKMTYFFPNGQIRSIENR
ncbi:MAG: hypothetical protein IPO78_11115 [Saprospiraceae bacterium]|nr:hypothetical protein [Saprospiraceae bacterium]